VVAAAPGGDPRLAAKLVELADDPYTDARFNAAAALARIGDPRAAAAIAEMLDSDALASSLAGEKALAGEADEFALTARKTDKRNTILSSAMSAIEMLLAKKPSPDTLAALDKTLTPIPSARGALRCENSAGCAGCAGRGREFPGPRARFPIAGAEPRRSDGDSGAPPAGGKGRRTRGLMRC
jgi:hypothetical protein